MSDITTVWNGSSGDWSVQGAALASGGDLTTAILISVMSDRVANVGDAIPDGSNDPRGWCGDDPANPIGSRIWLLQRTVLTAQTAALAESYLAEGLQWMIDQGIVDHFDIVTQIMPTPAQGGSAPNGTLGASVTAYQPTGAATSLNFNWAWAGVK